MRNNFSVQLYQRDHTEDLMSLRYKFQVKKMSWKAIGGAEEAEIYVTGQDKDLWDLANYLRYGVMIYDPDSEPNWWGFINGVQLFINGVSLAVDLDSLSNKIAVAYTTTDPTTGSDGERYTTDWALNAASIATYGEKQLIYSISSAGDTQAEKIRDAVLNDKKLPSSVCAVSEQKENYAILTCRGWWESLEWKYYFPDITWAYNDYSLREGVTDIGRTADIAILAKKFTVGAVGWTAYSAVFKLQKVGAPTDSVIYEIRANTLTDEPGTVLATATVPEAEVDDFVVPIVGVFATPAVLAANTSYWVTVRKDGAVNSSNYYGVTTMSYEPGHITDSTVKKYDGAAWADITVDLWFRVHGQKLVSEILDEIITECGQFLAGSRITVSTIFAPDVNEDVTGKQLAEDLLPSGASGVSRYLAEVNQYREAVIYSASTSGVQIIISPNGDVKSNLNIKYKPWKPIHGKSVRLENFLPAEITYTLIADPAKFFVERCTYDVEKGTMDYEQVNEMSWNLGVVQG